MDLPRSTRAVMAKAPAPHNAATMDETVRASTGSTRCHRATLANTGGASASGVRYNAESGFSRRRHIASCVPNAAHAPFGTNAMRSRIAVTGMSDGCQWSTASPATGDTSRNADETAS